MKNFFQYFLFICLSSQLFASVYEYTYSVTAPQTKWSQHDELFGNNFKEVIRFAPLYMDDNNISEDSNETLKAIKDKLQNLDPNQTIVTIISYAQEADNKKDQRKIDSQVYGEKIVKFFTPYHTTQETYNQSKQYLDTVVKQLKNYYPQEKMVTEARGDAELRFTTESTTSKEKSNRVMVAIYIKKEPLVDSDHDGVADKFDLCPQTPNGVKVDKNGCAYDKDKDDVLDYKDNCKKSLIGAVVDNKGCSFYHDKEPKTLQPKPINIVDKTLVIHFDYKLSNVKKQYQKEIDAYVDYLKKHKNYKVEISGHTDSRGSHQYNIRLSQKRANAIKKEFIKRGVPENQIVTKAMAATKPIATNKTKIGRWTNRRVEVRLIK